MPDGYDDYPDVYIDGPDDEDEPTQEELDELSGAAVMGDVGRMQMLMRNFAQRRRRGGGGRRGGGRRGGGRRGGGRGRGRGALVDENRIPLPVGSHQYTNADYSDWDVSVSTEKDVFYPDELIVDEAKSSGASGILTTLSKFDIAGERQLANASECPVSIFSGQVERKFAFDPIVPGRYASMTFGVSGDPGAGNTVTIGVAFNGVCEIAK